MIRPNLAVRVVLPVIGFILGVMFLLFASVALVVKTVAEDSRTLAMRTQSVEVKRILLIAVEDLVARELLDRPEVVEAKKKAVVREIAAFWAGQGLEGAIFEGEKVLYASTGFSRVGPKGEAAGKEGVFSEYRALSYIDGVVNLLPLWDWRVVTSTGPVNIVASNPVVFLLIPAVLLSSLLLLGTVWWVLRRNLEKPIREFTQNVATGKSVPPTGIAEVDQVGETVNRAFASLKRQNQQMAMLHDIALSLYSKKSFDQVAGTILKESSAILGVPHLAIALFRLPDRALIRFLREGECALPGNPSEECIGFYRSLLDEGRTVVVQEGEKDSAFLASLGPFCGTIKGFLSQLAFSSRGEVGLVLLLANKPGRFTGEDERLAEVLAADAVVAFERLRDTESLRQRDEHFRTLMEGTQDFIFELDRDLRVVYLNRFAAHAMGIDQETAPGIFLDRLFPPGQAVKVKEEVLSLFSRGTPRTLEGMVTFPNGSKRCLSTRLFGLTGEEGEVHSVLGISQDITERKETEKGVSRSLREKEALLHEIHHRVKNNLQVVSGLLEMASRENPDPGAREVLRESRGRIVSMALLHDCLYRGKDVDRVEMGEYLGAISRSLLASMAPNPSPVTLAVNVERVDLPINSAVPFGLIANELVTNAFKHAFPGGAKGTVRVEFASPRAGCFTLTVSDDGAGMPPGPPVGAKGHSLGLRLVRALAEQMGGRLQVTRKEKGTSICATFFLPPHGGQVALDTPSTPP